MTRVKNNIDYFPIALKTWKYLSGLKLWLNYKILSMISHFPLCYNSIPRKAVLYYKHSAYCIYCTWIAIYIHIVNTKYFIHAMEKWNKLIVQCFLFTLRAKLLLYGFFTHKSFKFPSPSPARPPLSSRPGPADVFLTGG